MYVSEKHRESDSILESGRGDLITPPLLYVKKPIRHGLIIIYINRSSQQGGQFIYPLREVANLGPEKLIGLFNGPDF